MFTQPATAPTTPGLDVSTAPSAAASSSSTVSPTSTSRSSRLRGLTYLRNYTQNHRLNRDHGSSSGSGSGAASSAAPPHSSARLAPQTTLATAAAASPEPAAPQPPASSAASATHSSTPRTRPRAASQANPTSKPSTRRSPRSRANGDPTPSSDLDGSTSDTMMRTRSATDAGLGQSQVQHGGLDSLPSIRFSTFYDPRATRPSLTFAPVGRTLPSGHEVIRVGRYSERDSQPNVPGNVPSAAPVGFKSKVVSRRHCEFWCEAGKWYIKDVKSSSGTFLNHIRLSAAGTESKPFPVNDGDIVQLGIDFKGGEEMIFRCVKMRLELNRGWQSKLNAFNMNTHKRLRNMTKSTDAESGATQSSQDCSICLNSIAPCQCLFVAPCSHTWHFKCIRSLLSSPQYPIFICPNCRAAADLEAEVEDPEEWEQLDSEEENEGAPAEDQQPRAGRQLEPDSRAAQVAPLTSPNPPQASPPPPPSPSPSPSPPQEFDDVMEMTVQAESLPRDDRVAVQPSQPQTPSHATTEPVPIPAATGPGRAVVHNVNSSTSADQRPMRTPSPTAGSTAAPGPEGPITPRNDAGPWVFDGSGVRTRLAGRVSTESRRGEMRSLDTVTTETS